MIKRGLAKLFIHRIDGFRLSKEGSFFCTFCTVSRSCSKSQRWGWRIACACKNGGAWRVCSKGNLLRSFERKELEREAKHAGACIALTRTFQKITRGQRSCHLHPLSRISPAVFPCSPLRPRGIHPRKGRNDSATDI